MDKKGRGQRKPAIGKKIPKNRKRPRSESIHLGGRVNVEAGFFGRRQRGAGHEEEKTDATVTGNPKQSPKQGRPTLGGNVKWKSGACGTCRRSAGGGKGDHKKKKTRSNYQGGQKKRRGGKAEAGKQPRAVI